MIFPSQITMTPDGGVPAVASSSHDVAADYGGSPMLPHELCRRWSGAQAKQDNVGDNRRPQGCPKKWKGDADHRDEEAADYGGSPVDFWLPHVLSRRGSGAQAKPDNVAGDRRPQGCLRKWKSDADRRDEEAGDYCGSPVDFRLPHVFCRRESGAQAKPDNVEDDRRPQGYPKKWQYDADRCPQGVDFPLLPHMIIGRRVPSPAPKTPPPSEVLQLPTAFRVPIPRDLPPGPWLPEEMTVPTTVLSRGEDSGYQNPSVNDGSQRNPPHEQRDGVSVDEGAALFPINMTNPCSPGRDRRSNPNNGGVGYQKRTTGCISDVGIGRGRFCNRSKDNDSRANYVHIQERRVIGNRHYEYLQKNNLQDCQVSKTQPIAQRNPLLNSIAKQKVKGQWVAVTKDEKHNLEARKQNGNKVEDDDLLPNGFLVNDTDQDGGCLEEQTKEHVDGNEKPTADGTPFVDDLTSDVVEGHSSTTEPGSQEDMEDFMFKIGAFAEEDLLDKFLADSLILNEKSSSFKHAGLDSVGKDLVSSSSRRIFRRSVHCRSDIENSTPHFLSVYRYLVLPAERESYIRNQLLCSLAQLAKEEWSNAQLHLFGSCANSFGLPSSDMDVCLSIDDTDMTKQNILLKLTEILQANNFQAVEAIANARIPIVKMLDPKSDISCDICINNLLAVANTKLLRDYAQIDDRLHQLAFIVKHWAKLRGVNNTYQGTLSSYAYVLMCIHFLQLRKPAILPCLQEMKATYFLNVDGVECAYFDHVETLHDFGAQNNESIARLVWEFFHYWAYIHDYVNHVISVRTGRLISKKSKNWTKRVGKDRHLLCIEDPFETSHDLGRVVDKCTISVLREEFERAADILQCDPKPWHTLFE